MPFDDTVLRSALGALVLFLGSTAVAAQHPVRSFDGPVEPVTYDLQTSTITRGQLPLPLEFSTFCFVSTDHVGEFTTPLGSEAETIIDWGLMGGTGSTSCADITATVTRLDFGYGTAALDTSVGGPGAALTLTVYTGYQGFGVDSGNMPLATFAFTGLPGISGAATSTPKAFFVGLELAFGFEIALPNGTMALGFSSPELGREGDGFADTGPILCSVPALPGVDPATGQVDQADAWLPDTAGAFDGSFGGAGKESWMWSVARADLSDFPATVSFRNAGTNPAVYTASRPIMGTTLEAAVDMTTTGYENALIVGFDTGVNIPLGNGQFLLILDGGETELLYQTFMAGPIAEFNIPVALHLGNRGKAVYSQGLMIGPGLPFGLTNAQDFVVGANVDLPPVLPPSGLLYTPPPPYLFEVGQSIKSLSPTVTGTQPLLWSSFPPLPIGISIDTTTGLIAGTPTALAASTTYTISVFNSAGQTSFDMELAVIAAVAPPTSLTYDQAGPFVVPQGALFGPLTPTVDGDPPFVWTSTPSLSSGLTLSSRGVLAGLALVAGGPTVYTIQAENSAGAATAPITITIVAAPIALSYPIPGPLIAGLPITPLVPSVAGGTPVLWTSTPPLPAGLSLDALGTISGTPTDVSSLADYTIMASNVGGTTSFVLPLQVDALPPGSISYSPRSFAAIVNSGPHMLTPTISGGGAVDTWEIVGGAPPPIMTIDPLTGVIEGFPTELWGPAHLQVRASNGSGSSTFDLTLEITDPPAPGDLRYMPENPGAFAMDLEISPMVPSVSTQIDRYTINPPLPNLLLKSTRGTVFPRAGILLPENAAPISYTPPEQTVTHPWEVLSIWLPDGTPPVGGWPVLLANYSSGYFGHPGITDVDPNNPIELMFHMALNQGIAVVVAGIIDAGPVGGWFYPPGHPSGRWEDPDYLMPEKDFLHALQWLKLQQLYPTIDPDRIFLYGVSSGSTIASYVALGPDRRQSFGSAQLQTSSRVCGVLAFDTLFSFTAYRDETVTAARHWESVSTPGLSASTFGDADPALRDEASIARILLDPTSAAATTPVFLAFDCPQDVAIYWNEPDGYPVLDRSIMANIHDLWNGAKFFERLKYLNSDFHSFKSEFFVGNGHEVGLGELAGTETGYFTGSALDSPGLYSDAILWMLDRAVESIEHPEGLQIHPKSGYIFGSPNQGAPTRTYTITGQNASGSDTATVTISVLK